MDSTPKKYRLYLLLCALCPALLHAAENAQPDNTLSVAFYESGFLYSEGTGIDPDVLDELRKRGGYHFIYREQPRARTWKALQDGVLAMATSAVRTPERDAYLYFIPYHAQKNMALTVREDLNSPADLIADPMARIAIVRGFQHGEIYDEVVEELTRRHRVVAVPNARNLFLMLDAGNRVEAVFAPPVIYRKELHKLELKYKVRIMDWSVKIPPTPLHLALSKKHFSEQDYRRMAAIVQDMREDGTLRRLIGLYLSGAELESALQF